MTAVGKILVFLNLVFAFVVGAFAVLDYTARTHWAVQYEKLSKDYTVEKSTSKVYKDEADRLTKERDAFNQEALKYGKRDGVLDDKQDPAKVAQRVTDLLKKQKDEIESLKRSLKTANDNLETERRAIVKYKADTTVAQTDTARRQDDVEKLRTVLKEETTRNTKLVEGINYMRDRAVAAEIEAKSLKGRNSQLEAQLQDMARDLVRLKASGASRPAVASLSGRNPPPEQVEGLIQRIDGNLVTLSIGSDAGLQKGHTMYVFGLAGNVGYRGEIKLVEVTPKLAVGEVKGKLSSRIRIGDTVSSDIMPRR